MNQKILKQKCNLCPEKRTYRINHSRTSISVTFGLQKRNPLFKCLNYSLLKPCKGLDKMFMRRDEFFNGTKGSRTELASQPSQYLDNSQ